jgi:hypothetical protein
MQMTDIIPEAVAELWEDYLEAARPDGGDNTGGIELYDIEGMNDAAHSMYEALRALSAALERSQAETAAAYEAAAREIDCGGCNGDCPMPHTCCAYDASAIRALTPADIKAALDRMIAAARADGMREAAAIANTLSDFIPAVILAAIPKGKDHE